MNTTFTHAALPGIELRERLFFLRMAYAILATVLVGFGTFIALGISSFQSPWWVHVHAVSFMAWIGIYLLQNRLVYRDQLERHRAIGRIAALLALWMVAVGLVLTPVTLWASRIPPFFTPAAFLALDWVNISTFAVLVGAALHFRRQTDWHRRLMLCATICVMAPAIGRLLALANLLNAWTLVGVLLVYVVIAIAADLRHRSQMHPAYAWGAGLIFLMAPIAEVLTLLPPFQSLANYFSGV